MDELGDREMRELRELLERVSEAREIVRDLLVSTGE